MSDIEEVVEEVTTEEVRVRFSLTGLPVIRRWRPNPGQLEMLKNGGEIVFVSRDTVSTIEGENAFDVTTEITEVRVIS